MSERRIWSGGRLGPYHAGKRYRETGADLGRIYEAHNVETGAPALLLTPGRLDEWRPRGGWTVPITCGAFPPFLAMEVIHAPRGDATVLQELTLMLHRFASALARVEDREDTLNLLTREPRPRKSERTASRRRWLLAGAGAFTAMALVLAGVALWPRAPEPTEAKHSAGLAEAALDEPSNFIARQDATLPVIGYPLPDAPLKGQMKPPCGKEPEVEIHGGCWVQMKKDAPCPRGPAEYEGKCYMPVGEAKPEPRSLQP